MGASDKVAQRYAEIFVSVFDGIMDDPSRPVLRGSGAAQCGASGVAFRGSNALATSIVASQRGFTVPVWLTRSRIQELGLLINPGERNTPVVNYNIYYEDVRTGRPAPGMDDNLYRTLSDDDRRNWVKRCYMNSYPEFNICQTNFAEVYPDQWAELVSQFGSPAVKADCPALDRAVGESGWLCPVRVSPDAGRMVYIEKTDEIRCAPKASYPDQTRYYGDLAYVLSRSTGSEGRLDRGIQCSELEGVAREELVSELAAATVATLAGVSSCIQEHNLAHLKGWVNAIGENPRVIFQAVTEASRAAEMVSSTLGLELRSGFSLDRMMEGVESAREAREKAIERRQAHARSAGGGKRKGRGRKPVKVYPSGGGKHI